MKIRIRGNSIRYRLDKTDLELLVNTGKVESSTHIGAGILHFCLRGKDITDPVIKIEQDNGIHLLLPNPVLEAWYKPDQVGFEQILHNSDGSELTILIEKDFKCVDDD
ncbi:DUF7009 family protein [Chitinophaga sp. 30R24]|uniref:DUF7009 family protein n=1 Tax=Chitinophaga sp. 30R24 TaxID=3248838 RepID=UPI003B8FDCD9